MSGEGLTLSEFEEIVRRLPEEVIYFPPLDERAVAAYLRRWLEDRGLPVFTSPNIVSEPKGGA